MSNTNTNTNTLNRLSTLSILDLIKLDKSELLKYIFALSLQVNNLSKQQTELYSYIDSLEEELQEEDNNYHTVEVDTTAVDREKVLDLAVTLFNNTSLDLPFVPTIKELLDFHNDMGDIELTEQELIQCLRELRYSIFDLETSNPSVEL